MFLGVNLQRGLFVFDQSYRPVPLGQSFIGIKGKSPLKRDEQERRQITACLDKCLDALRQERQVMIFVHSRKATYTSACNLMELARSAFTCSPPGHQGTSSAMDVS